MILALLTSSIAGLAVPADPAPVTDLHDAGPGLTLVLAETELALASRSLDPLLVLVAGAGDAPRVATWIEPGGELWTSFARGALDGLRFEVVQRVAGTWRSTGALEFQRVSDGELAITWVFPSGVALSAADDGPITPLFAGASLLPKGGFPWAATPETGEVPSFPASPMPLHVPVPEPSDRPESGTPPKLERKPLPPV